MTEFFEKTEVQVVFLAALLAIVGWAFLEWRKSRPPKLGDQAKRLLAEIKGDSRSSPKGITVFNLAEGGFYEPFRWIPSSGQEVKSIVRDIGMERAAVEELVAAGFLTPEEAHETYETYRLV